MCVVFIEVESSSQITVGQEFALRGDRRCRCRRFRPGLGPTTRSFRSCPSNGWDMPASIFALGGLAAVLRCATAGHRTGAASARCGPTQSTHPRAARRAELNATGSPAGTVRGVRVPGGNHVDRRRRLLPRDYLADPHAFGRPGRRAITASPVDGDARSARIAALQHDLVTRWRRQGCRPSGASLGRAFGFSRQTWSRAILGERWMGEAVQAALVVAVLGPALAKPAPESLQSQNGGSGPD